ncbi:hypothetical protein UA08_05812 [Talaromyces atroroseus]|uniref:Uncharacterized protein n=1 Tax=Talaromyces atroroseus TaxID=1441469 RepID=A0A225AXH6_TALAT|nr:hypothetical protein UA08_05812 [Talaromyces atroroseus]OKL59165.1 hypothetical protein UA08_05812 [Talaromyces atroroseus]
MVIGVAMMAAMVPTVYAVGEASNRKDKGKEQNRDDQEERYHLITKCHLPSVPQHQKAQVHNARVYLDLDGRIYISQHQLPRIVPFAGYFYSHPDLEQGNLAGLVTVSPETPPQLRWTFLDSNTHEMRWGGVNDREGHISGPFGLHDDGSLTLNGSRRWMAVRHHEDGDHEAESDPTAASGLWRLYFDSGENHSVDLPAGAESIEIELEMVRYPRRPTHSTS